MKNYLFVLVLFLAAVSNVHSQKGGGREQANTSSYITLSPMSLFDLYAPRLRVGYVQHIAAHWKIGLDFGAGGGTGIFSSRESENDDLWEVRPEIYYILKPESQTIKYVSTEFFYISQSNTLLNDTYSREDGVFLGYDRADFERQKYGMHFKFGLFLNTGRRWGFNFYGGVGFRRASTSFSNVINANEDAKRERRHGFNTIYDSENSDFRPNPTLGAKVYYRF